MFIFGADSVFELPQIGWTPLLIFGGTFTELNIGSKTFFLAKNAVMSCFYQIITHFVEISVAIPELLY